MYQNRHNSILTWMYQESDLDVSKDDVNRPLLTSYLIQEGVRKKE